MAGDASSGVSRGDCVGQDDGCCDSEGADCRVHDDGFENGGCGCASNSGENGVSGDGSDRDGSGSSDGENSDESCGCDGGGCGMDVGGRRVDGNGLCASDGGS